MRRVKKRHTVRNFLLFALLAVACAGAAELALFRANDPAGYEALAAPVRAEALELAAAVRFQLDRDAVRAPSGDARVSVLRRPMPEPEPLPEVQEAGEPAIETETEPEPPAVTELRTDDGLERLTGGSYEMVYYNQKDEQWTDQLFGRDPIGRYGCGPTAMSMVVSSMTGETVNPAEMAAWAAGQGYCAPRSGSYLSIVEGTASYYKLICTPVSTLDVETLRSGLSTGGVMVALMGPGHFTKRGHFIVLRGVTLTGEILVADPNSRENSLTAWDAQLILDELSSSRHNGAPLWKLEAPPPG